MLAVFGHYLEREKGIKKCNTAMLAKIFLTFQFNVDGAGDGRVKGQVTGYFPLQ